MDLNIKKDSNIQIESFLQLERPSSRAQMPLPQDHCLSHKFRWVEKDYYDYEKSISLGGKIEKYIYTNGNNETVFKRPSIQV